MNAGGNPKSLKDQNRLLLWLAIALNGVVFYTVSQTDVIFLSGWQGLFSTAKNLAPVGFALIATTVANGLLTANFKARLVFCRWTHALPGHRAFSTHAPADARINLARLKESLGDEFPIGPEAENLIWYRLFKEIETVPEVDHIHREFLFMRDYAGLSAMFLVGFGGAAFFLVQSWNVALTYCLALILQFIIIRHVAANYGTRFVCTVLAVQSAKR